MNKIHSISSILILIIVFSAFTENDKSDVDLIHKKALKTFGVIDPIKYLGKLDSSEIELGRMLFESNILSKKQNISCASCHDPKKGFGDALKFSTGTHGDVMERNTPHLFNLVNNKLFFWDGRANSLQDQFEQVLTNPKEMDMTFDSLIIRLNNNQSFTNTFNNTYGENSITKKNISDAMAAFEKSILVCNTPFDQFLNGDRGALNEQELKGLSLFMGKAKCIECHKGTFLEDGDFHNTGTITDDEGRQPFDRVSVKNEFEMRPYPFFASFKAFKTPSLRNSLYTAPYFHDGSELSLEDVIEFYNQGGKTKDKTGLAKGIEQLNLSDLEKQQLLAFLKTLSEPKN